MAICSGYPWVSEEHRWICNEELTVGVNTIPKGAIIDGIMHESSNGEPVIKFRIGCINYVLPTLTFLHFFDIESDVPEK